MAYRFLVAAGGLVIVLAGCGAAQETSLVGDVLTSAPSERVLFVAADERPCIVGRPEICLQIRYSPRDGWMVAPNTIVGFEHQPGVEYRLKVRDVPRANPGPGEPIGRQWLLVDILDQRPGRP